MSNLEKVANYTPAEMFGATALAGGGTFATIKLLKELMARQSPLQGIPLNSQLSVDIPTKKKEEEQLAQAMLADAATAAPGEKIAGGWNQPIDNVSSLMLGTAGLPVGFMGTKLLYDAYKSQELASQLEEQKKQYAASLQQAKFGAATPELDAFCQATADELNKLADVKDWRPTTSQVINRLKGSGPVQAVGNAATGGLPDKTVDAWWTLAGGTAAVGLAGLIAQNRKRKAKEEREAYPNRVILNQS